MTTFFRMFFLLALLSVLVHAQEIVFQDGFESPGPTIDSVPVTSGRVDEHYYYDVEATDPGGEALLYLLLTAPGGMSMGATSGVIDWLPLAPGDYPVEIDVSNSTGRAARQAWVITVTEAVDTDNDGLSDAREELYRTDPENPDSDGDGLEDGEEVDSHGSDPLDGDTDTDNLGDGEEVGTHATDPIDPDTDGDSYGDGMEITAGTDPLDPDDFPAGPPDPRVVAPPLDTTQTTMLFDATAFLYSQDPTIQSGVVDGAIDPLRAALLRGYVMTRDGLPLPGAVITIRDHAQYGQTISRADGMFDMVVNGGGPLTVNYQHANYLPGQRLVHVAWQTWHSMPDMALVPLDSQVTAVDLQAAVEMQVAQGSPVTDADGTRQATVLFPQGTTAMMRMPDDTVVPVSDLSVRATEYTVGENGPAAMPGDLPLNSAYTYAVELSIDEAMQAGAETVEFSEPIPFYVDNFLEFPAGVPVPSGYYDRERGTWVASDNGLVIDILDETGGLAVLDIDDSGTPAGSEALEVLGITDAEREQMANLYEPGDSLWRVPIAHFSAWDSNWGFSPPPDALPPFQPPLRNESPIEDGMCSADGSVIECQNQVLGKRVPIAGTPYTLNYRSGRVEGNLARKTVGISLSGGSVPASLMDIELELSVAGQVHRSVFPPDIQQQTVFTWNGKDVYGRKMNGAQQLRAKIGYRYQGVYGTSERFGYRGNGTVIEGSSTRDVLSLPENHHVILGTWDQKAEGLGGWSLDVQHAYDVNSRTLYRGDGSQRGVTSLGRVISTLAGTGVAGYSGDGGPADEARLNRVYGVAVGPDGAVYIADLRNHRVRKVDNNGIITTYAGTGNQGYNGDGIPATEAELNQPRGLAFGPDGNLYIGEDIGSRVRMVDSNGIIHTVAGDGNGTFGGDGGPATEAQLYGVEKIAFASDGTLYIADSGNWRVRRVDSEGVITTIAGTGTAGYNGDNILATEAQLNNVSGVAVDDVGNVYISDAQNFRIRKVDSNGIITTYAGTGDPGFNGDGLAATDSLLGQPAGITFDPEGNLYIADDHNQRIRMVSTDGILTTVAGSGPTGQDNHESSGDGGPATAGRLTRPEDVAIGPDGRMFIAEFIGYRLRVVEAPMPGYANSELIIPSADGSEVYRFNAAGKHLQTLHGLTGAVLQEFDYDGVGRLVSATDGDGKITSILRNDGIQPSAIVGSFGHATALSTNPHGYLDFIVNPANESLSIATTPGGQITRILDPRGRIGVYDYDALGRLGSQSDNAGFSQVLARTSTGSGFSVLRTTGLGRSVSYDVQQSVDGVQQNTNTAPDSSQNSAQFSVGTGSTSATSATGMSSTISEGPDPRFGMLAVIATEAEISAPGGPTLVVTSDSDVDLNDDDDPFSLVTLSGTSTIAGRATSSTYTAASKILVQTTPEGRSSSVEIDDQGRIVRSQFGDLAPVISAYNNLGQLTTLTHGTGPSARVTTFVYGPDGFWDSITDPLGRTTTLTHDAAGRMTSKTLPGSVDILFGYNAAGELDGITPPGQPEHGFLHSLHGQVSQYVPPTVSGGGVTGYTYNADRQILSRSLPDDELVSYVYDNEGRLASVEVREGGVLTASYVMSYGVANRLDGISGPGSQQIGFDYQGDLLTAETWSGLVEGSVSWTYDDAFRVASETVTGGATVNIGYDDDDLPTSLGDFAITRSTSNGLAQSATLGVLADSWTHNEFGEVTGYTASANAVAVYDVSYTLDDLGRITQKVETIGGVTTTYDYDYDLRGQLIEVQADSVVIESYSYDDNGNRLSATVGGLISNGSHDEQDRLTAYGDDTYEYTGAGRRTTRTEPGNLVTTYDYDPLGNLHSVTLPDATLVEYRHDGSDRRVQRSVDGAISHRLLYDDLLPLAELDELGNVVSQFVYVDGNVPVYLIRSGVNYRLVSDHLGSVRLVVNATTGAIIQRIDYDAFGNVLQDTNPGFQPFGFAGGIYDPLTGLVQFGTRDYDPHAGRWTAKDLIGFGGADTNLYRYANNNPVNLADPVGTGFWSGLLGFVGGVGDGLSKALNPARAVQSASESLTAAIEDWLGINNDWRGPNPGSMFPPPPGVDQSDYLDGHFYGECTVDIASLAAGGGVSAWRNLPRLGSALSSRLGRLADKLGTIPELLKGAGKGLRPLWDEAYKFGRKWGKKALDEVYSPGIAGEEQKLLKGTHNRFGRANSKPAKGI